MLYFSFYTAKPEYDLVVRTFDILDGGFWGQSSEQGAERCRNIILSLRVKEAEESIVSTEVLRGPGNKKILILTVMKQSSRFLRKAMTRSCRKVMNSNCCMGLPFMQRWQK